MRNETDKSAGDGEDGRSGKRVKRENGGVGGRTDGKVVGKSMEMSAVKIEKC